MQLAKKTVVTLTTLLLLTFWLTGCSSTIKANSSPTEESKLKVAATIFPLADMARAIGGQEVEVVTLLPPGSSPHTFEPTPEQMKQLAQAKVFIKVGAGLDSFADKLAHSANPDLVTVSITDGLVLSIPNQETKDDHQHDGGDPHVWLDPVLVREHITPQIATALATACPGSAAYFNSNLEAYNKELELLHQDIEKTVSTFRHRNFVTFHSVWLYFCQRYDLEDITIEAFPSKEPSALWLTQVINRSRASQARSVFVEPQVSAKAAEIIAAELGIPVYTMDPLGAETIPEYDSYLKMMRSNLKVFEQALR